MTVTSFNFDLEGFMLSNVDAVSLTICRESYLPESRSVGGATGEQLKINYNLTEAISEDDQGLDFFVLA
ncbi:MAG: hypothetical protein EXR84_14310 [Gammaproteobacteria bacterium]|nr:hypothetical protein [Gammaproteobacteria bacterium]